MKDMGDVVILSKEEYESLMKDVNKLERLEAYGVDNWQGYEDAISDEMNIFEEEE